MSKDLFNQLRRTNVNTTNPEFANIRNYILFRLFRLFRREGGKISLILQFLVPESP